jgi:L-iditol 2-dehydrogenase
MIKTALKKGKSIRLDSLSPRELPPDGIRLRVEACGICGTDLHVDPESADQESPFGHEIAGTITEIGSAVTGLETGRRVILESCSACGKCEPCRNTQQELCTDLQSFFFGIPSFGFAEEMVAPAISAIPCDDVPSDIACLSEPLGVAIDMVRLADITPDSNVLLMGSGPIGLMALQLARMHGARRVFLSAFERNTARVALAKKIGVDAVVDPSKHSLADFDFGCRIDRVLVTTPPPTLADAKAVAAKGAIISFIGIAFGENAFCRFNVNDFHFKKLQLRASFASPALQTPLALQYLRESRLNGNDFISHRFPLDEIGEAMRTARDGSRAVKVIVQP